MKLLVHIALIGGIWQDVSDLYTTSIDLKVSEAGTHIIQVQDLSGNISYNLVSYTYVDETNPVMVSEDSISNTNTFMVKANEDIFEYSIDDGFSWTELVTPNPFTMISVTLEGTYQIKVKDQAGLESEAVSFTFDITAPSVTSYAVSKTDGMLYVEASESIYRYSLNNGTSFTTLSEVSNRFGYVLANEGDYTFDLVIEDYAGNQTAQTITVTYDKTAPYVTFYEASKTDGMLYVEASESIYRYSLDNGTSFTTLSEISNRFGYVLANEGDYTFDLVIEDYAGNQTAQTITVTYDKTAPYVTFYEASKTDGMLYVEASESIYRYSLDNGTSFTTLSEVSDRFGYVLANEGDYTFDLVIEDYAGNQTAQTITVTYDKTAPYVTSYEASKTDGMLYVEASESIYRYSLDNGTSFTTLSEISNRFGYVLANEGDYTFDLVIEDYAGNQTAQTITVTYDKTAPVLLNSSQDGSNNYTFVYDESVTAYSYDLVTWEPLTVPADTFTVALTAGTYQVYVRDAYENVSLAYAVVVE